jgi:uncharacterized membrane protein YbaN (DUF454 family)
VKILFISLGTLFLGLGFLGIALPLVPTTPFLLLAAACYARSSTRIYNWMLNHRLFGDFIRNYRSGSGIPLRAKIASLVVLWSTIGISLFLAHTPGWVPVILVAIALGISVYILSLPTVRSKTTEGSHVYRPQDHDGKP